MLLDRILNFFKPSRCRQEDPLAVAHYFKKQNLRRRGFEAVTIPTPAAGAGGSKAPRRRPGFISQ